MGRRQWGLFGNPWGEEDGELAKIAMYLEEVREECWMKNAPYLCRCFEGQ
jgi:hypothetical protein